MTATTSSPPGQPVAPPMTRFGRRQTKGVLLGLSWPRLITIMLAVIVVATAMLVVGFDGLLYSSLVWAPLVAVAFVRWQGAPLAESVPVVTHWGARQAAGQTRYRVRPAAPRPAGTMALPGDAAALRYYEDPETNVAMVHDPHRSTLTAVVQVSYPAFVLLDADEQTRRVAGWSKVLSGLAATGQCACAQVLESVIPDPGQGVAGWWAERGVHDGSWPARQYETLLAQSAPAASVHRTLIAVSLDLRRAARAVRTAGRGMAGAAAVLTGDMANLGSSLTAADLHVDGWLDAPHLASVIREAYEPGAEVRPDGPAAHLPSAGPAALDEHWDYLRHDSGFSTVLWISDWPTQDSLPNFMHALVFTSGIRKSIAIIMRPVSTAEAIVELRKEKVDYVTDRRQKDKAGRLIDESDNQEYQDVLARERALIAGHADMRYSGFVAVTAAGLDQLRADVSQVQRLATQCMMHTRILYGRQAQGFIAAALPLGRGVS